MDQWQTDLHGIRACRIVPGVSLRIAMHVREHARPRTQKKWDKRFGVLHMTIPSSVMLDGVDAVRAYIRRARALALRAGKRRP